MCVIDGMTQKTLLLTKFSLRTVPVTEVMRCLAVLSLITKSAEYEYVNVAKNSLKKSFFEEADMADRPQNELFFSFSFFD